jgi:hypothetical protein
MKRKSSRRFVDATHTQSVIGPFKVVIITQFLFSAQWDILVTAGIENREDPAWSILGSTTF